MDKKSLTYSAVLLLGLVFVSVLLNRGIIQGVHSNSHVTLTTDQSIYPQGGDVIFTGEIEFSLNEQVDIKEVRLKNVSGPTGLDAALPLAPTSGSYVNVPTASGTLMVKVDFLGITTGSSTPGTIPGTTLPGGSDGLKGVGGALKIVYTAKWTPPNTSAAIGSYSAKLSVELKNGTMLESSAANYSIVAGTVVAISGPMAAVDEGSGSSTAIFIIKVSPPATETIVVNYRTVDGTATAGADFTGITSASAVFTGGQATTSVAVTILDDSNDESTEEFSVELISPTVVGSVTVDTRPAKATIIDNDADPTVTLALTATSTKEGNSGTTTVSIPVNLSAASQRDVTVNFATKDGTATAANNDYVAKSGALVINAGGTTGTIDIDINGDTGVEGNETFELNLMSSSALKSATDTIVILNSTTTITITNDDAGPSVSLSPSATSTNEGDTGTTTVVLTLTQDSTSVATTTVNYSTADGTATAGSDYVAVSSGVATIPPGNTTASITVEVITDTTQESSETFNVNVTGVINGTASTTATSTVVTIVDDDAPTLVLNTRLQAARGAGNVAVVEVIVDNVKDPSSGATSTAIAGGIKSFSGKVTYSDSSIQILGVQDATEFAGTAFATSTGQATFSASATAQTSANSPIVVAKLIVILTGSKNATTTLTLDSLSIVASTTGATIGQDSSAKASDTYQR
ncbi:MAG: Calx-beta domain-containing protein, partial [SAR202 cluster bacterium]|nr:Calx-beta domain-containing protein [SAR202 cluster bacterium]